MNKQIPNNLKVLIAEDDPAICDIVTSSIEMMGHVPIVTEDGQAAIDACADGFPNVAILDLMMPYKSGDEVCKWIKQEEDGALVPVLILTAKSEIKDKVESLQGGADDYLTKPFDYRELQARVHALLRVNQLSLSLREKNLRLEQMQERIVQQERALLAGQLAGTAAHQLGQPLSAIMLNCHLLSVLPPDDERYTKAITAIKSDADRMSKLIEELKEVDVNKTEDYYEGTKILSHNQSQHIDDEPSER